MKRRSPFQSDSGQRFDVSRRQAAGTGDGDQLNLLGLCYCEYFSRAGMHHVFGKAVTAFLCILSVSLIWMESTSFAKAPELPNIVLCMGDDHGWDETSYNEHPYLKTPELDAMAASGLRLDRFYAAHPTCSPTRGSFLTGRHPNRYATFAPNYSIRPDEITIAHLLKKVGYATAHFGKWHLGPVKHDSPTSPGACGFDTWLSHDNFFEMDPWLSKDGEPPIQLSGESSEILVEHAIEFMKECRQANKPYFVVIWFGSPHEPYSGKAADLERYDFLPADLNDQTVRLTSNETGKPTTRSLRAVLRERYAEITALDRSMGVLRSWIYDKTGQENTMLWYCGDNGSPAGASTTTPLRGQKATLFEGGIRVPGIIEWPAVIQSARQSAMPVVTSDIFPTLCDIANIPLPSRPLDGISLVPLLQENQERRSSPICFWQFRMPASQESGPYIDKELQSGTTPLVKLMNGKATRDFVNPVITGFGDSDYLGTRVILDEPFKLIVSGEAEQPTLQLFQLQEDPNETTDVVSQYPDRVKRMRMELHAWQTSVLRSATGADYRIPK